MGKDEYMEISLTGTNSYRAKFPTGQGSFAIDEIYMGKKMTFLLKLLCRLIGMLLINFRCRQVVSGWADKTVFIEWSKKNVQ